VIPPPWTFFWFWITLSSLQFVWSSAINLCPPVCCFFFFVVVALFPWGHNLRETQPVIFDFLSALHPSQYPLSSHTCVLSGHASLTAYCWNGPWGSVIFQSAGICFASLGKWCLGNSLILASYSIAAASFLVRIHQMIVMSPDRSCRSHMTYQRCALCPTSPLVKSAQNQNMTICTWCSRSIMHDCISAHYFKKMFSESLFKM